jgi:hypothetical protein
MEKFLVNELLKPIARRVGSMLAAALVALVAAQLPPDSNLAEVLAQNLEVLATAFGLLLVDLYNSAMSRRK